MKCDDRDELCFIAHLCDAKGACALKAFIKDVTPPAEPAPAE